MGHRQTVRLIAAVALIAVLGSTNVARAVVMMLEDTDGTSTGSNNAKYKVTYANGNVAYDSGDVGRQQGTVTITDTFTDCSMHTFTFMQTALPTDDPTDPPFPFGITDGLRLNLELHITNNTGQPWSGFWVKTDDQSVPANLDPSVAAGGGNHDHRAHFHPSPASEGGPPSVTGMPVTGFMTPASADINNKTMFLISGGTQTDAGNGFSMTGFFLHERNLKKAADPNALPPTPAMAVIRTFDLVLMPHCVPELSSCVTWLFTMLGCAGLTGGRRRL